MTAGLPTKYLLRPLQPAGSGTDTHAPQQGDVELGVNATVEVPASRRDAPLSFEGSEVLRSAPDSSRRFADMKNRAAHRRRAYF